MPAFREESTTVRLQRCLDRVKMGDPAAQEEMIRLAWKRLQNLAGKVFRSHSGLHSYVEIEDLFQNAIRRFWESLQRVQPASVREFFALAALQIRRTLSDMVRHYYGPMGPGVREEPPDWRSRRGSPEPADPSGSVSELLAWGDFHNKIGELPGELREVFELMWYHQLARDEIARLLNVSVSTVRTRWRQARLELFRLLNGHLPRR